MIVQLYLVRFYNQAAENGAMKNAQSLLTAGADYDRAMKTAKELDDQNVIDLLESLKRP